MANETKQNS